MLKSLISKRLHSHSLIYSLNAQHKFTFSLSLVIWLHLLPWQRWMTSALLSNLRIWSSLVNLLRYRISLKPDLYQWFWELPFLRESDSFLIVLSWLARDVDNFLEDLGGIINAWLIGLHNFESTLHIVDQKLRITRWYSRITTRILTYFYVAILLDHQINIFKVVIQPQINELLIIYLKCWSYLFFSFCI